MTNIIPASYIAPGYSYSLKSTTYLCTASLQFTFVINNIAKTPINSNNNNEIILVSTAKFRT